MRTRCHIVRAGTILISILLIAGYLPAITGGSDSLPGAIWTTDANGERVNGNQYSSRRDVYLYGGPDGSSKLPVGGYYYQVTDTNGNTLLSTDPLDCREFSVNGTGHLLWVNEVGETVDGPRQLWFFASSPDGQYKVWVTRQIDHAPGEGSFGFIPSLSKTDNFKVSEAFPKCFQLLLTEGVDGIKEVLQVQHALDVDGDPNTPGHGPWATSLLDPAPDQGEYKAYVFETSFEAGTIIYWRFLVDMWTSPTYGPEVIDIPGMVNSETLFLVSGHRTVDSVEPYTINLTTDGELASQTCTDASGYYELIAYTGDGDGSFNVSCQGWAANTLMWHEVPANGTDQTYDFEVYEMLQMSNIKGEEVVEAFEVVFTPVKKADDEWKLSSTNTGSFFLKIPVYGGSGEAVDMAIYLPPDRANIDPETGLPAEYDSPNFQLHHVERGSTSTADIHIYEGDLEKKSADITDRFDIATSSDGKWIRINEGVIPEGSDSILVKVHVDFNINATLTTTQVGYFQDFEYTFIVGFYGSFMGGSAVFGVG